ncbi:hypothetical protein [Oceanobacillus sp. FSL H7-0719]|uniref:hypothetical protein n=1 Tax=Oceanobacillus sp. FSL H7-0719 TaxID=2954507 RepID=UPI0032547EB6
MKKLFYFIIIITIFTFLLAGCGEENNETAGDNNTNNTSKEKAKEPAAQYEEVTTFALKGPVTTLNFNLDEDGDTLLWGENDGGFGDALRRNVWVDDEVKSLDFELFNQFSFLTPTGYIISKENNPNAPEGEKYSIIEYNPSTEEVEKYPAKNSFDDILLPGKGTYLQEPKIYVHTDTNPNIEKENGTYIWDVEKNEFIVLSFIDDIKEEVGEITSYANLLLNKDASKVYGSVLEEGIFSYDVKSGTTERLLASTNILPQSDKDASKVYGSVLEEGIFSYDVKSGTTERLLASTNILPQSDVSPVLSEDEKYMIYGEVDPEASEVIYAYKALNLETDETIELGDGKDVIALTDGNVIIIDKSEVTLFDFDTGKLETIHTIELEENQKMNNLTVSLDGSTIAYGYETEGEDDEEDTYHMSILRKN